MKIVILCAQTNFGDSRALSTFYADSSASQMNVAVTWLLILKLARMTSSAWPHRYNTISKPVYLNGHWYQIAAFPSQIDSLRLAAGGEIFFLQSSQITQPQKKSEEECTGREGWCCCCLPSDMAFRCACVLVVQTLLSAHRVCVSPVEWKAEIVVIFKMVCFIFFHYYIFF